MIEQQERARLRRQRAFAQELTHPERGGSFATFAACGLYKYTAIKGAKR